MADTVDSIQSQMKQEVEKFQGIQKSIVKIFKIIFISWPSCTVVTKKL